MIPLTTPIKLDLTPFGALSLLVNRVNEIKGQWTESLDTAMQQAEEVIQCEQDRLSQLATELNSRRAAHGPPRITLEPKAAFQSIHPDNPPLTCVQLLEHARDSMDAADVELQAANKLASGMASLLLLDMIRETGVMACRIRAILAAASNEAGEKFNIWCEGDGSWMTENPRIFTHDKTKAGFWNREVADRLCPGGAYRIYPVMTPEGTNPDSPAGAAHRELGPVAGGKGGKGTKEELRKESDADHT